MDGLNADRQHLRVDPAGRLAVVARQAGLDTAGAALLESHSNDVWLIDDVVVRVCWRGDRTRLRREALLLECLPPEVPHAQMLGHGAHGDLAWMLTKLAPGAVAAAEWTRLDGQDRRRVLDELGRALAGLHHWTPPAQLSELLVARAQPDSVEAVVGADVNPLPVPRALFLIEAARSLPGVDPTLVDELAARLVSLARLDPFTSGEDLVVVHGDAHLGNVLWDGERIVVLDFEWVRWAPADLELQSFLRTDEEGHPGEAMAGLRRCDPDAFGHPNLVERLWLYDLAFTLRHLVVWPPPAAGDLPGFHPLARLPAILEGPAYIEAVLP